MHRGTHCLAGPGEPGHPQGHISRADGTCLPAPTAPCQRGPIASRGTSPGPTALYLLAFRRGRLLRLTGPES